MLSAFHNYAGGFTFLYVLSIIVLIQTFRNLNLVWKTPVLPIRHLLYSSNSERLIVFLILAWVLWQPKLQLLGAALLVLAYYVARNVRRIELTRLEPSRHHR